MADLGTLEHRTEKMRGLMLGLALGDAVGGQPPPPGVLRSGVATQLACFTIEGLVRASMRMSHKGILTVTMGTTGHARYAHKEDLALARPAMLPLSTSRA